MSSYRTRQDGLEPAEIDGSNDRTQHLADSGLSAAEVRTRAVTGSAMIAARGIFTRSLGLLSGIVLARLLLPEEIGMVAFGSSVMVAGAFFADGGLAAGLLRRASPPTANELGAILGLQLAVTTAVAVIVVLCALPFGTIGIVTSMMVAALPATAFRTPAVVLLERQLNYRPIAVAEVVEAVVFLLWVVVTVAVGFGVYGLASAWIVRSLVGSYLLFRAVRDVSVRPSWSPQVVKPLLGFGIRYQAVTLVNLLRDQGLNMAIALVAGVHVLGLWSIAYRVLQVPYLLFGALWRVSYPALARLLELRQDPNYLIARGLRVSSVSTGLVLVPFVAMAPGIIPVAFGPPWQAIVPVIVISSAGLLIAGPISVASAGYLYAVGDAKRVLLSAILHTLAWFGLAVPLLPAVGVAAVGIGWAGSGFVEGLVMALAVQRRTGVSVMRSCWRSWCAAAIAVGVVLSFPTARSGGVASGTAAAISALCLFVGGLVVLREEGLHQLKTLVRGSLPNRRPL